jgi:hypothetical protein
VQAAAPGYGRRHSFGTSNRAAADSQPVDRSIAPQDDDPRPKVIENPNRPVSAIGFIEHNAALVHDQEVNCSVRETPMP